MSSFTRPLIVTPLPDGKTWQLVSGFSYFVGQLHPDAVEVYARAGTKTDFASTPRIIWWLFPPWGKYGKAAVLHDYMYQTGYDRSYADYVFHEAMFVSGTKQWKANIIYWAVRAFGWYSYNKYRKDV